MANPPGFGGDISSCIPYESRKQFSLDFWLCEQGNGWPYIHFANALLTVLFFPDFFVAGFVILLAELLEWTSYILIGIPLGYEFPGKFDLETMAGSYVGDLLAQGGMGMIAGFLLFFIWKAPPLSPLVRFKDVFKRNVSLYPQPIKHNAPGWAQFFSIVYFIIIHISAALAFLVGGGLNYGIFIHAFVLLFLLIVYWVITAKTRWSIYFWSVNFSQNKSLTYMVSIWVPLMFLAVHNIGLLYIGNNQWTQSWVIQAIIIVILGGITFWQVNRRSWLSNQKKKKKVKN